MIGIDMNDEMLALARRAAPQVALRTGFARDPYAAHVELIEPRVPVPSEETPPFPCTAGTLVRDPRETKSQDYRETIEAAPSPCGPANGSCC